MASPATVDSNDCLTRQENPRSPPPSSDFSVADIGRTGSVLYMPVTSHRRRKKAVRFSVVVVYSFAREQGFCTIPDTGWCSLGMAWQHFGVSRYDIHHHQLLARLRRKHFHSPPRRKRYWGLKRKEAIIRPRTLDVASKNASLDCSLHWSSNASHKNLTIASPPPLSPHTDGDQTAIATFAYDETSFYSRFTPPPPCLSPPSPRRVLAHLNDSFGNVSFTLSDALETDSEASADQISTSLKPAQHKKRKLSPIHASVRLRLLRESGVTHIDESERGVCLNIRASRSHAGCACGPVNSCLPEKCSCIKNGVPCQVDRARFPCSCSSESCCNPHGRTEFPQEEVRAYVLSVLQRSQNKISANPDISPDDSSCPRVESIAPRSACTLCTTHNTCCQRQDLGAYFLTPVTYGTSTPTFHDQERCAQFEAVSYSLALDTASSNATTVGANCNWTQSDLQCVSLGSV